MNFSTCLSKHRGRIGIDEAGLENWDEVIEVVGAITLGAGAYGRSLRWDRHTTDVNKMLLRLLGRWYGLGRVPGYTVVVTYSLA